MLAYLDHVDSPAGPLTVAVDAAGAVIGLDFLDGDGEHVIEQTLERGGYTVARDPTRTAQARAQLLEYAAGTRQTFDLPLVLAGTAWQQQVWRLLLDIPFGETRSYGELAAVLGKPHAARAVGRANATNRIALIVPCHRVVGADGALTGYAGGLHLKARLLEHEAQVRARSTP